MPRAWMRAWHSCTRCAAPDNSTDSIPERQTLERIFGSPPDSWWAYRGRSRRWPSTRYQRQRCTCEQSWATCQGNSPRTRGTVCATRLLNRQGCVVGLTTHSRKGWSSDGGPTCPSHPRTCEEVVSSLRERCPFCVRSVSVPCPFRVRSVSVPCPFQVRYCVRSEAVLTVLSVLGPFCVHASTDKSLHDRHGRLSEPVAALHQSVACREGPSRQSRPQRTHHRSVRHDA